MENDLTLAVKTKGAEEAQAKIKGVASGLSETGKSTNDLSDKLTKAGLAIGAIGVGLTAYSKSASNSYVDYVKQTNAISRVTGEAIDQTSRLQYVFSRSGVGADQAATVFGTFSKQIVKSNEAIKDSADKQADLNNKIEAAKIKIGELTDDTKKNGDANGSNKNQIDALNISIKGYQDQLNAAATPLQKLGVQTQDNTGKARAFSDILLDVADKFKAMPNGAEKTAISMQLFGRSGKDLIPILNKGSEGIKDLEAQADKLGVTLTDKNVDAVAKYTAAQKKMKDAQTAFTLAVGAEALPMYQKLADAQVALTEKYKQLPEGVQQAVTAVVAFGGPVATAAGSIVGFGANLSSINWKGVASGFSAVGGKLSSFAGAIKSGTVSLITNTAELVKNAAAAAWTGIQWLALKVAQGAVIVGTYLWTAAQWALNVALNANPIALIIIALVALAAGIVLLWQHSETFRNIVTGAFNAVWGAIQAVWNWIAANWPTLLAILTGPIGIAVLLIMNNLETIKGAFAAAWNWIKGVFAGVGGFFQGVWNTIVNIFSTIGATIGNSISGAVKGVVNGILSGAEGIINGFINSINGVVGTINKIPGVNIGKIGQFHLPRLAQGGIVPATPGGRLAVVGEGGQDEAVIPLNKLKDIMGGAGSRSVTIGTVNLNSAEAVREFYAQLDNDTILSNRGLTPIRGNA